MMEYKGYVGRVDFDEDNQTLYGEIIGTRDVITFEAESARDARKEFEKSVDEYLKFCEERGRKPEKPFSGQFITRADPELHRKAFMLSSLSGLSLNAWIVKNLRELIDRAWSSEYDLLAGPPSKAIVRHTGRRKKQRQRNEA